jgi:hypothetical protein
MRGAVSVALATAYFDLGSVRTGGSAGLSGDKHRATLVVATLLTVLITIVGHSGPALAIDSCCAPPSAGTSVLQTGVCELSMDAISITVSLFAVPRLCWGG